MLLSAQGRRFDQRVADELAALERIVLICGRYEGVDERVGQHLADRELSIGDYVLSGGELGAAVIVDTVTRLIPGAVGNEASTRQESFTVTAAVEAGRSRFDLRIGRIAGLSALHAAGGLSRHGRCRKCWFHGNHEEIRRWRRRTALEKTLRNRPDLLEGAALGNEDKELLARITGKQN